MSHPKLSYPIGLTEEEKKELQKQARAHKTGQDQVIRAKLLFVTNEYPEWSNPPITKAVGMTDRTVYLYKSKG